MTLSRAYYCCDRCNEGSCPRDAALGLAGTSVSPAVTRMIGLAAAMVSFEESGELLDELAGVKVNAKQVERTAEALGAEVAADERGHVEAAGEAEIAPTMYLGMDGTGVPMRKVDRFHAKEHLCDVAKIVYGATSDLAAAWAKARHDELDAGKRH